MEAEEKIAKKIRSYFYESYEITKSTENGKGHLAFDDFNIKGLIGVVHQAMEERAQNQVNAYKEELRKDIEGLIDGLDIRIRTHEAKGYYIQQCNKSKRRILYNVLSLLDKPQDNG